MSRRSRSSLPMRCSPRKFALSIRRYGLTVALALAYLMAIVGLPWPTSSPVQSATPFPCQGHQCGCQSAEQCWGNCCCFSPAQRIIWAVEHHISPPAELLAAVDLDHDECSATGEHSHHDSHPAAHSCCHKNAGTNAQRHAPVKDEKTAGHGFRSFKCHGISTLWVTTGAVVPSVVPATWTFDWNVVGTVPIWRFSLSAVPLLPAVPPPRVPGGLPALAAV